jgi:hypothetical protein
VFWNFPSPEYWVMLDPPRLVKDQSDRLSTGMEGTPATASQREPSLKLLPMPQLNVPAA